MHMYNKDNSRNIYCFFLACWESLHEREGSLNLVASVLFLFPTRSDGLHLSVELHTSLAVEVQISSERSLYFNGKRNIN